jgi:hypothetical protein
MQIQKRQPVEISDFAYAYVLTLDNDINEAISS